VRRLLHAALPLALVLALSACGTPAPAPLRFTQPVVLLGEVHDNAAQHALRLDAFRAALAAGARPAPSTDCGPPRRRPTPTR
jgi:hypothetical protein